MASSVWVHRGVRWVAAGWSAFIAENLVLSHNRDWIIAQYGDDNYHIAYNILSTLACASIGVGFFKYGKLGGPSFRPRGPALQAAALGVQALGLVGLSQLAPALQIPVGYGPAATNPASSSSSIGSSNNTSAPAASAPAATERKLYVRCPVDFKAKSPTGGVYGMERVSRHSALWFMGISTLGSALVTPYAAHAVMFTFPLVFAFIGGEHQDYRYRRSSGGYLSPEADAQTSNVPFLAMLRGAQSFETLMSEMKWTNAGLGALTATLLAMRRLR